MLKSAAVHDVKAAAKEGATRTISALRTVVDPNRPPSYDQAVSFECLSLSFILQFLC